MFEFKTKRKNTYAPIKIALIFNLRKFRAFDTFPSEIINSQCSMHNDVAARGASDPTGVPDGNDIAKT